MRALQARFKDWILSRSPEIDVSVFADRAGASREARFRVYEKAYWIRMTEAIEEDLERTRELIGPERLRTLVREYVERTPSTSWTLAQAGQDLPDFVRGCHEWHEVPFLLRVVEWDWLRVESFLAPVVPDASPAGAVAFRIDPSVRAMALSRPDADTAISRFDVDPLVAEPAGDSPLLLVWRTGDASEGFSLEERVLVGRSAEAWRALAANPDPDALAPTLESLGYDEESARALFTALSTLGMIVPG
jgi:hypothetical protein